MDGASIRWSAVVVVEHPAVPEGITPFVEEQPNPSVVLLRRDWEFLFEQLKSTHAIVQYIERVAGNPIELGEEVVRYFQLAQADEATPPGVVDPRILGPSGRQFSAPLLPMRAAATDENRRPHLLLRAASGRRCGEWRREPSPRLTAYECWRHSTPFRSAPAPR